MTDPENESNENDPQNSQKKKPRLETVLNLLGVFFPERWEAMEGDDDDEEDDERIGWKELDLSKFLIFGAFISSACEFAVYPFDLIKTRLQMQGTVYANYSHYHNFRHACVTIAKKEGIRGFYRGAQVTFFGTIPGDVLYYGSYEFSRYWMMEYYKKSIGDKGLPPHVISPLFNFIAGGLAEVASSIFWVPTDIIAQKVMVQGDKTLIRQGPFAIFRDTLTSDGLRGIYRGYLPTISNFAFHSACNFTAYELARSFLYRHYPHEGYFASQKKVSTEGNDSRSRSDAQKSILHLLAGSFSGAVAGALSTPIDVVKTRLQVQNYYSKIKGPEAPPKPKYTTFWRMMGGIIREEGFMCLTRGMAPRVLHSAPNAALTFLTYEFVKNKCQFDTKD